ncbi:YHS domain-containing protein [Roseibacillus persicicus]
MNIIKRTTLLLIVGLSLPALADSKEKKEELTPYPLTVCIVSDETLGEMGKPQHLQYDGQIYSFCCKPCTKEFKENPKKFAKKLAKEIAKQNKETKK